MKRHASTNRFYRLIWSYASDAWIAVAEIVRTAGKSAAARAVLVATVLLTRLPLAVAAPTDGQITSGAGSISQSGVTTTIHQTSANLSLNWNTFNIAPQDTVDFLQPSATAIAVNRIFDTNGTQILGHLNANGQVYLINPNGILFGKHAQVNIGGLVASTLDLIDPTSPSDTSSFNGDSTASVVNAGTINASKGGYVALLGNHVSNQGVITAQMGTVALAAGSGATLTFSGNNLLHLKVDQSVLKSVAENGGLIRADGGQVLMSAGAKKSLLASVVNNTGVIQARTMETHDGSIVLLGGMQSGEVAVGGTVDASSMAGHGGQIVATADNVLVASGASVNAAGATGGGTINIGGGWEGGGGIDEATTVSVEKTATLNASATANGNGGEITVRSAVNNPASTARVYGTLLAQGGAQSGNGGNIETSGRWLDVAGITVDASAARGPAGEWLLDPFNVIIGTSATGTTYSPPNFAPGADSTILASTVGTALSGGNNVTITTGTSGSSLGDITVNSSINKASGANVTLTLQAADSVIINQAITNTSTTGNLAVNLYADNSNGVHDGVGVVILNNSITTKGGAIIFGDGATMALASGTTEVGGDVYVGGSSAITLSTAGGAIGVHGQMIIANSGGVTLNTANGNVTFDQAVDSGDSYAFVTQANVTWPTALAAAKAGLGANVGDTYLATITSRLENAVAGVAANYVASWLGAQRVTGVGTDAIWRWVAGPEGLTNGGLGLPFFTQNGSASTNGSGGAAIGTSYINWNSGEPNNSGGTGLSGAHTSESVMQFVGTQGQWNDLSMTTTLGGYVKETNLAPSALTVSAGTGVVTFSKALGSNKPLASLTVTAQTIALTSPAVIDTTGAQSFTGQVTVGGADVNLLTVSASNLSTTYGAGVPALTPTYTGFVNGNSVASLTTQATVSTTASATPNAGSYPITASGVVDSNYFIIYNPGLLIVNPATLTVTPNSPSKFYGQANPALIVAYAGFMYGDTTASLTTAATASTSATTASNAGSYAVTASGAVPSINYTVAYVGGTLTVNPAMLTVSGFSGTARPYNASLVDALSGTGSLSGLLAGQTLTFASSNALLGSANAGTETLTGAITLANGTGGGLASNYVLTQPTLANVSIAPAPLTVTGLTGTTRTYNASTIDALAGTGLLSGLVNGETLTLGGINGTLASPNAGSEALTTAITLLNDTGLASNYVLTQPTLASVTIAPAPLSVSGLTGTARTYNGSTVDLLSGTAALSGLINGQTLTPGNITNGTLANANAGSEAVTTAVTLGDGTGLASNYVLTQSTLPTVMIAQAPLTVSGLTGTTRTYNGSTVDALSGTGVLSGLVSGETLTLGSTNGTLASPNAGSEPVTAIIALGDGTGLASNYVLTQPMLANVTITPAPLSVSGLTGTTRTYNGDSADVLAGTASLSGLINGQTLTLASAAGVPASPNAGSEPLTAAIALGDGTGLASNYVLTQPTLPNVTITQAPLTVTGLTGTTRTYNASTTDALTGTGSLSGLFNSENLILGNATSGTLANANAGSEALSAAITLLNGTGLASNYVLTQPTLADVTITPAPLTLSGLSGTGRIYNRNTSDALTGTASLSGLIAGQTLTLGNTANGTLASANAGSESVMTTITLSDGTGLASNYVLTQPTLANVTIMPAPLTVTGTVVANKVYDGTTAATLSGTLSGVIAGDTVSLDPAGNFASKNVGTAIAVTAADALGASDALNYTLTQPTGLTANITVLGITVTATGANKVYDGGVNDAATLASAGVIAGDAVSFNDTSSDFADKNVGNAKTVTVSGISASGLAAANYSLNNTTASTSANITQLGSVTWVGPATGGSWSNPANWAGGAIPDLSNVANVVIPMGDNVTFDSTVAGPVNLNRIGAGGLIVDSGTLNVATALNLTNYAQSGGAVGGTGSFTVTNSFSQTAGQIDMESGTVNITQAQGNLSFANIAGGLVILASPAGAIALANLAALGDLDVTAHGGAITQSMGTTLTIGGMTALSASNGGTPAAISLTNAGNAFLQAVSAAGGQIGLIDAGPLTLGTIDASGNLTVASTGALDLGTSTVGGHLAANSGNGNVTQNGALSVAGTSDVEAGTGNIQLSNAGNTFIRSVSASGGLVSLRDAGTLTLGTIDASSDLAVASSGALDLGTAAVGGNLAANSGNGNVTQDGVLSVAGMTNIVAGTGNVQLANGANAFLQAVSASGGQISLRDFGTLSLGTVITSGDLHVASSGALDLGTTTVGASLIANSGNGTVTQEGPLQVTGTTGIVAGTGGIQLTNLGNILVGAVNASGRQINVIDSIPLILGTSNASSDLTVGSNGGLDLGTATVGGSLVANSGNGAVTQDGPLQVTGTTDIQAGTGIIELNNPDNVFDSTVTAAGSSVGVIGKGLGLPLRGGSATASVANIVSQLESSVLASNTGVPPDGLSLSPTISVLGNADSDAVAQGDESVPASSVWRERYVTTNIGPAGPMLRILNGGLRLPDRRVDTSQNR